MVVFSLFVLACFCVVSSAYFLVVSSVEFHLVLSVYFKVVLSVYFYVRVCRCPNRSWKRLWFPRKYLERLWRRLWFLNRSVRGPEERREGGSMVKGKGLRAGEGGREGGGTPSTPSDAAYSLLTASGLHSTGDSDHHGDRYGARAAAQVGL